MQVLETSDWMLAHLGHYDSFKPGQTRDDVIVLNSDISGKFGIGSASGKGIDVSAKLFFSFKDQGAALDQIGLSAGSTCASFGEVGLELLDSQI